MNQSFLEVRPLSARTGYTHDIFWFGEALVSAVQLFPRHMSEILHSASLRTRTLTIYSGVASGDIANRMGCFSSQENLR